MCFHSEKQMKEFMESNNITSIGFVIMRDKKTNEFQEAYFCDVTNTQDIANTIRNLRAWHPGDHVVDLTEVNKKRRTLELYRVSEINELNDEQMIVSEERSTFTLEPGIYFFARGWNLVLPEPTGTAPKSEDDSTHVENEQLMAA